MKLVYRCGLSVEALVDRKLTGEGAEVIPYRFSGLEHLELHRPENLRSIGSSKLHIIREHLTSLILLRSGNRYYDILVRDFGIIRSNGYLSACCLNGYITGLSLCNSGSGATQNIRRCLADKFLNDIVDANLFALFIGENSLFRCRSTVATNSCAVAADRRGCKYRKP